MTSGIPIPPRLRELVLADGLRPIRQPAIEVAHARWRARLDGHADVIAGLPALLDRDVVQAMAADSRNAHDGQLRTFIADQVWGYGTTNYGPHRLAEALRYPGLSKVLDDVFRALSSRDPVAAFQCLCVDHEIPWTAMAYGSKHLYFADPTGRAVILDSVVAGWLQEHCGLRMRLQRDADEYGRWLELIHGWSMAIGAPAERLELIIFSDGLSEGSNWRPPVP